MWNKPSRERLEKIPKLYETEEIPLKNKTIHLHFFMGSCDWYVVEYDGEDTFFGYAVLYGDLENAEWGYISFQELRDLKLAIWEVDCELEIFWKNKKVSDVPQIVNSRG